MHAFFMVCAFVCIAAHAWLKLTFIALPSRLKIFELIGLLSCCLFLVLTVVGSIGGVLTPEAIFLGTTMVLNRPVDRRDRKDMQ